MREMMKVILALSVLFCGTVSCKSNNDYIKYGQQAKAVAETYGSQNPELIKLYNHAVSENDADIMFLLANLENKSHNEDYEYVDENGESRSEKTVVSDIIRINADSVIRSVEHSRKVWSEMPWRKKYPKEYFREYVLPYYLYDYELKSPSKEYIYSKSFDGFDKEGGIVDNAMSINIKASQLPDIPIYMCDHWTRFSVSALRAAGLPAAEHSVLQWGDLRIGHSMPALLLPDGKFMHFEEAYLPKNTLTRAMPKLYRKMYSIQDNTVIYNYREEETIPAAFAAHNLKDVTGDFPIHTKNIKIKIDKGKDRPSKILYLSIFSRNGWVPTAYAGKKNLKAVFNNMGTGHQQNGDFIENGQDIGKGIVYLPCFYINNQIVPVGHPIIAGKGPEKVLKPDTINRQTMALSRKYPLKGNTLVHIYHMLGGVFEASSDPAFEQRDTLYTVSETPRSTFQTVEVEPGRKYTYARYRMPYGIFSMADMRFFDPNGNLIPVKGQISDELSNQYESVGLLMDGDPLTHVTTDIPSFDVWSGVEFTEPAQIAKIEFCPRNDGNDVFPGDEYELFYWDDKWIGMGRKVAQDYQLTYENVPSNSLCWLFNYTKGEEERLFTYENGKQVWW